LNLLLPIPQIPGLQHQIRITENRDIGPEG
jgi:hypothetical protein